MLNAVPEMMKYSLPQRIICTVSGIMQVFFRGGPAAGEEGKLETKRQTA